MAIMLALGIRTAGTALRSVLAEALQICQILRAACGALHRAQMVEAADSYRYALDAACKRFSVERDRIKRFGHL
jgi:hypothetical protein